LFDLGDIRDITAPYRLVRADLARRIASQTRLMKESFWTEFTIRAVQAGARVKEVGVSHKPRLKGETVVYRPTKIPEIAYRQLRGIMKLTFELRSKS
jgi:hypothetical protein